VAVLKFALKFVLLKFVLKFASPQIRSVLKFAQIRSPVERHRGEDKEILVKRDRVYAQARERNPSRWSGETRNWTPVDAVALNPERASKEKVEAA
jgi:hypothetical protein